MSVWPVLIVAEVAVDGTIERRKGGDQQHHDSAGPENGRHAVEGLAVVLDVLERVQTDAGVGVESGQIAKRGAAGVAGEGVQVASVRVALGEALDAIGLAVNGDDSLAVEQHASEVAEAAANLDYPSPQLARDQAALPGEIILRPGHAFLIFKRVSRLVHAPL